MTFLLAVGVAIGLPSLKPEVGKDGPPRPGFADMLRAWRYVKARPKLLATVLAKTPPTVANSGAWVTLNLVAGQRLSFTTLAIAIGIVQSIRAIEAGLAPSSCEDNSTGLGTLVALLILILAAFDSAWLSFVGLALWGIGQGHNWVISTADLQTSTLTTCSVGLFLSTSSCSGGAFAAMLAGYLCAAFSTIPPQAPGRPPLLVP